MKISLYNNNKIKLQGVAYYIDCYKFWDLNHCADNFSGPLYQTMVMESLYSGACHPYTGEMAVIDLNFYEFEFDKYQHGLSPNVKRDVKRATSKGFYFKEYNFNHHLRDFSEINHSQRRKKQRINEWYLQEPTNYEGANSGVIHKWEDSRHYSRWFGVFKYLKHYKQGDRITNEKLFAYCKVAVDGEMASIHLVWAHGDFLKQGLMFYLLSNVAREVFLFQGVRSLVYYGYGQFPKWKSRLLFKPTQLEFK